MIRVPCFVDPSGETHIANEALTAYHETRQGVVYVFWKCPACERVHHQTVTNRRLQLAVLARAGEVHHFTVDPGAGEPLTAGEVNATAVAIRASDDLLGELL